MSAGTARAPTPPGVSESVVHPKVVDAKVTDAKIVDPKIVDPIDESFWQPVMELPCRLTVEISAPNFRVKDFLALRRGAVITSAWRLSRDVPLRLNGAMVGWGELEQVGKHLAVRLTELV